MNETLERIAAALELIAATLAHIAGALDPEELERRKAALLEQLAHDLAAESEKGA